MSSRITPETWKDLLREAYGLFDDAVARGFESPPFRLGGGTVLMFHFKHRLSKDIDLFGYDAQWLPILSPRLNDRAAALALYYSEQSATLKIVLATRDIYFIIAPDLVQESPPREDLVEGRRLLVEAPVEILAKKLFYRASAFTPRDVYDMSAAIDLAPDAAARAVAATRSRLPLLSRRLDELGTQAAIDLTRNLVPYDEAGAGLP